MEEELAFAEIERQRDCKYRRARELRLHSEEEAAQFIDEVGLCLLFPNRGIELPSLWEAICGERRRIPHHHDDYELGLAWNWKDSLPSRKRAFYGKYLKRKPTLISLKFFPYFYALSENYGGLDDYLIEYEDGKLSYEAKCVYEALLEWGALPTSILRHKARLGGKSNAPRFDRALVELQAGLKIAKVGISDANRWKYCYVYDLLPRWLPDEVEQAKGISRKEAMREIILRHLDTVVIATPEEIGNLFRWGIMELGRAIDSLVEGGRVMANVRIEGKGGYLMLKC